MGAAAVMALSCAKEPVLEPVQDGGMIPLNINSSINQKHTKATAEGFVDKDALGLYAVNYSDNNTSAGTLMAEGNQADNVKYVFDEANHKWNPVKAVYYKDVNTHVDLYAYYPYRAGISEVNAVNFEVAKDQSSEATDNELSGYEASDFLWGKAEDVTPTQSAIAISLSHKLSAVEVSLVEGNGFGEGEFEGLEKSIILTSTTRKATIDYATGVATALGYPQIDGIVMCPQSTGSWRAVVIPQTVAAGVQLFAITVNGMSYRFTQSDAVSYQAGKQLSVSITVNKKTPVGDLEFVLADTQIVDWAEDRNTHGGEARQYFVVNVTEPGTLGTTIEAMGKNPAKIKNLKVIGTVNADDFYFMRDEMTILEAVNLKESICQSNEIPDNAFKEKKSLIYLSFPEDILAIGQYAFYHSGISGPLILPDEIEIINAYAFSSASITSISLPKTLKAIGDGAFENNIFLSGNLTLPDSIESIGTSAFDNCHFTGYLHLPDNLELLGRAAFHNSGTYTGNLEIPDKLSIINGSTFEGSTFSGSLVFEGNPTFAESDYSSIGNEGAFEGCHFKGELVIPEGVVEIPGACFFDNDFTTIIFPSSLRKIDDMAFYSNGTLMGSLDFPEGLVVIGKNAFEHCGQINDLYFPSTLTTIGDNAFNSCFYVVNIFCNAIEPPTVFSGAFNGIAKDNFTIEVPAQSVREYQSEPGWSDFRRIAAHYDFSVSREKIRALNAEQSSTYTLRAPANFNWNIQNKPDWVTVYPESGTGKTDITVTVSEMERTSSTFEVNEGTYNNPSYQSYNGRSGEVVFQLDEDGIDYTCSMEIEQYDCDYSDGYVQTYQTHSKGNGIDIIFVGDGYDAKDISQGIFLDNAEEGYEAFFNVEPYKTYKDYFNVYAVVSQSDDSGIGTVNTIKDSKFGTYFTQNRIKVPEPEPLFSWAMKANNGADFTKALVINLLNASAYEGVCAMYADGSAIAFCPVSHDAYPYDYRGIIQHEAGGHGFGKLGDEYIYHNAFIQTCDCMCCEHPKGDDDQGSSYGIFKSLGWYKNLSMNGDAKQVPWAHLIYNPNYSDYVDMYEGGYMHSRGIYRSEATSCMNNNIPYYSAISRQAIVERILEISGEGFTLEKFYSNDSDAFGSTTKSGYAPIDRTFGVDPLWNLGSEEGSVVYMGEHPDYSKIK